MSIDTNFDCIQDFNYKFFSTNIDNSKDLPDLFSQQDRIMYLKKISNVFSAEQGKCCLEALRQSQKCAPTLNFKGGERDFYISQNTEPFPIYFDCNGKVKKESIKNNLPIIQKFVMERLAVELQWKDTTHHLACNAVDYNFTKDSVEPLDWHCDQYQSQAKYSMVVLLSDPNNEQLGWTGGDFLYTAAKEFKYSKKYEVRQKFYELKDSSKGEISNDVTFPIWSITPSQNDAILFGNQGMQHKITSLQPRKVEGSRMILTVFDYGTTAELEEGKERQLLML